MLSIRRACYDKAQRCPGWAGGGFHYPKAGKDICESGIIPYSESRWDHWMFKKCGTCGTIRLPINSRWLDPSWLKFWVARKVDDWKYGRQFR